MIIYIAIIFIALLTIPLIGAYMYYLRNDGMLININQDKSRDPRYFGKSFASLVEANLDKIEKGIITLSKPEEVLKLDKSRDYGKIVEPLVIGKGINVYLPDVNVFNKEIYGEKNVVLAGHKGLTLRAGYSKKNMIIGKNTKILRWIDANETLAIYDNCDLGMSASSRLRMSVGNNCKFRRLYAPEIRLGSYPSDVTLAADSKNPIIYTLPVIEEKKYGVKYVTKEMCDDRNICPYTIVSDFDVIVSKNLIVQGDIRSNQKVRLMENAVVCGSVFAEDDIYIDENATILGSVFSQESIIFKKGATVGQSKRISSVVARGKIHFEENCFVFGYISSERYGFIESSKKLNPKPKIEILPRAKKITSLEFNNLEEYENINHEGYRFNQDLLEVSINVNTSKVFQSLFYACKNLESVNLPSSLESLNAYSFCDCESLKNISLGDKLNLKAIKTSVFENCTSLKEVEIPKLVESIGPAAFSGCSSLENVYFQPDAVLSSLSDHSFRGCKSLKKLVLPKNLKIIGQSAFLDCDNLAEIILPIECKDEVGLADVSVDILKFYTVDKDNKVVFVSE